MNTEERQRVEIVAPSEVVLSARATMGAIDFDPFATVDGNRLIQAARFYDREENDIDDLTAREWNGNRTFIAPIGGAQVTRRLLNKLLLEYRSGRVNEAVIWLTHNESLIRLPWLWSFPICMPFRRLRPTWYDDETNLFRTVSPAFWSTVIYMPPIIDLDAGEQSAEKVMRFYAAFSALGRIVHDTENGSDDWEDAYDVLTGKPFNYRG